MKYNNIKKLYTVLISFWVINFFLSLIFLIPNTDESYYIAPAIGFFQTNELAFHLNDYTYSFFERFPLYSLVQGFFFKIISPIISINFYSYRLLNIIVFLTILILSFIIIKRFSNTSEDDLTKIIFFPIILSISPIVQNFYISRPEFLGILFVLLGVYFCLKDKNIHLFLSGLFFGLSVTCHPTFLIINFYIFLYIIFLKRNLKNIALFGLGNLFPIILLIIFYYNNLPDSISQLSGQASELPYFKTWQGLLNYSFDIFIQIDFIPICNKVDYFGCSNPLMVGMINSYYHFPVLVITATTLFLVFKKIDYIKKNKENYLILFLLFSSITILIVERNHGYVISLFSFLVIFVLLLIPWKFDNKLKKIFNLKKNYIYFSLVFFSIFLISSWNIIHFIKFQLYPSKYLNNSKFLEIKDTDFSNYEKIIITRPEIIPFFFDEINKQYENEKENKYLWFFPQGGRAMSNEERINSLSLFKDYVEKSQYEKVLWIMHKKNLRDRRPGIINNCFRFNDPLRFSEPIIFNFNEISYVFNSNKHTAFHTSKTTIGNECIIKND